MTVTEIYVVDLKHRLMRIFASFPQLAGSKFFFFGSRVTGHGDKRADIDVGVGVLGPAPVPAAVWLDLQDDIEDLPFRYKIDLVDFQRVSLDFREVALHETEEIGEL